MWYVCLAAQLKNVTKNISTSCPAASRAFLVNALQKHKRGPVENSTILWIESIKKHILRLKFETGNPTKAQIKRNQTQDKQKNCHFFYRSARSY